MYRSHNGARVTDQCHRIDRLCNSEIRNFRNTLIRDQDIMRFYISVNDVM